MNMCPFLPDIFPDTRRARQCSVLCYLPEVDLGSICLSFLKGKPTWNVAPTVVLVLTYDRIINCRLLADGFK